LKPAVDGQGDLFRNVVLRVSLPATRYVRAVEFRPGAGRVIHHAVITVDRTRSARRRDGADGEVGYDGMIVQEAQNPDGHFIGWTPGRGPIVAADGLQWRLDKGSDLIVQLHLLPGKIAVPVNPTIGLFFTDTPPARTPLMVKLGSKAIDIPAGQTDYAIADSYTLPVDVDLVSLYPHAHYLGREMHAEATLPDGTSRRLLHIPQWSFHWQQDYRFVTPVRLPRGTTVSMRYTYDNSSGNRFNTNQPPKPVRYGANSADEMGDLWLQLLPHSTADAARLASEFQRRDALASVAGAEMLVRHFPDDPKHLTFLGGSYAQVGRLAEASTALEKALRLDPRSADAHNYLGGVRLAERRLPEVIVHFTRAADLTSECISIWGTSSTPRGVLMTQRDRSGGRWRSIQTSATRIRTSASISRLGNGSMKPCRICAARSTFHPIRSKLSPISRARWPSSDERTTRGGCSSARSRCVLITRWRARTWLGWMHVSADGGGVSVWKPRSPPTNS
jgi:hypothetical protein